MSNPTITDLHAHLFAVLAGLRDGTMTPEQAGVSAHVAQTIVNVAKVEVDYLRVTGQQRGSGFLPAPEEPEGSETPTGVLRTITHRLRG